jgi:2-(1,2-epoxy-1,2-dihydrophenyl)acetyl-CoA isomerase
MCAASAEMPVEWPTGTDVVTVALHGRVAVITLNRPARRNAIHYEMHGPITRALEELATRDDVGCIVLTGAGVAFCAGGDVKGDGADLSSLDDEARAERLLADAQITRLLHEHPRLTIAAVNGSAVGAGMALALACDLRIAATSARLITGWARFAFTGDYGGAWFLTRLIGPSRALELLATNASLTADEAHALGLVNRVVADSEFADTWMAWAAELASGPTAAIAGMKANVHDALELTLAEALPAETQRMIASRGTPDHREAVRAWREQRAARFPPPAR